MSDRVVIVSGGRRCGKAYLQKLMQDAGGIQLQPYQRDYIAAMGRQAKAPRGKGAGK